MMEDLHIPLHHLNDRDFKRFAIAFKKLLEYLGLDLDAFKNDEEPIFKAVLTVVTGKAQEDITGTELIKEALIEQLINKEGSKDKALLTVVAGKTKNDPPQYLLETQSLVLSFVDALLLRNAQPTSKDDEDQNPIYHAVERGFRNVASRLLKNDDHVKLALQMKNGYGSSALQRALTTDDKMGALIIRRLPNEVVQKAFVPDWERKVFVPDWKKQAEYSFSGVLHFNHTNTALEILESVADCEEKRYRIDCAYRLLTTGDLIFCGATPLEFLALTQNETIASHHLVKQVIEIQWEAVGKRVCLLKLGAFLLSVLFMTFAAISGEMTSDPTRYDSSLDYARAFCEVGTLMSVFIKGFTEIYQMYRERRYYWKDFTNYFDLASICCLVAVVPLRWNDMSEQWHVFAVGYLIWILDIFKYSVITSKLYTYAQTPKRMASGVIPQFTIVFLVILVAFSGSFLLALRGDNLLGLHDETSNYWKILFTGVRILIEGEAVVDYAGPDGYK